MVNKVLLKDIATITTGSTAPKDKYFSNNGLPFIRAGHLETLIDKNNINELPKIDDETGKQLKLKKVNKGTILFAKSGMSSTKNRVYICTEDAYIVNHLAAIIPDSRFIDNYFLKFFLEWFKPSRLIIDESYPSIRTADIGNIEIQLPSLENQMKIVKILNKAKLLIKTRKAQIESLDQLTQSVFLEMFGDPRSNPKNFNKVSLGELFEIKTGGTPSRNNKDYWNGDIPWVKTTEVNENVIIQTEEFISEEGLSNSNAVLLPANTLLIAMYGQGKTRGRTAKLGIEATTNQACAALLANTEIEQDFIWKQLIIQYKELRSLGRGGNQPNLNLNLVRQFEVIVPPDSMQREFVGIIKKIDNTKNILKQSMEDLENMFNSLMQRAFKGELFTEQKVSNL